MLNEVVLHKSCFVELNENESMDTNGGAFWVPALIGVGVALVANEVVERTTGKSVVTHVGDGIKAIGGGLQSVGDKLWK